MWGMETGGSAMGSSAMKGKLIQALKLIALTPPVNFFRMFGNSRFDNATFVCFLSQGTPATSV